ncbi:MAG: hypothetical protein ACLP6G_18225 [Terriglobales bacterium]
MSFRVLVIPEDPTYNGYILKPLVERVLGECGKPNARVMVLTNPKADGYEHAKALLGDIFQRYKHHDVMLFLPDADGKDRSAEFQHLEKKANDSGVKLICCAAVQEVEVWLLAGHTSKLGESWNEVRADVSVKENIFDPFLRAHGDERRAGGGRDVLIQETLTNYAGLLDRCPELRRLQESICQYIQSLAQHA